MLKRLNRLWKLSKKDPKALEDLLDVDIDDLPDEDSKAEFFDEGTEEELRELEHKDKYGVKRLWQ